MEQCILFYLFNYYLLISCCRGSAKRKYSNYYNEAFLEPNIQWQQITKWSIHTKSRKFQLHHHNREIVTGPTLHPHAVACESRVSAHDLCCESCTALTICDFHTSWSFVASSSRNQWIQEIVSSVTSLLIPLLWVWKKG